MNHKWGLAFMLVVVLALALVGAPERASAQDDETHLAYAYGMNDLSVKIVAVVYNYSGMVWESFDGGILDSYNAVLELNYVEDILGGAYLTVDDILITVDVGHPVYEILSPHLLCYEYFFEYLDALAMYFEDPTDESLDYVLETQDAVEPYMEAIGLEIGARGEV